MRTIAKKLTTEIGIAQGHSIEVDLRNQLHVQKVTVKTNIYQCQTVPHRG